MSKARDRMLEDRLRAGLHHDKPRVISLLLGGKVVSGMSSTHKLRSGRLYNLRLRLWRRFHTDIE